MVWFTVQVLMLWIQETATSILKMLSLALMIVENRKTLMFLWEMFIKLVVPVLIISKYPILAFHNLIIMRLMVYLWKNVHLNVINIRNNVSYLNIIQLHPNASLEMDGFSLPLTISILIVLKMIFISNNKWIAHHQIWFTYHLRMTNTKMSK